MNSVTTLPNDSALVLGDDLPSLGAIIKQEPRGAVIDQSASIAKSALDVPELPGANEANEQDELHRRLVAANLGLNGRQLIHRQRALSMEQSLVAQLL